MQGYMFISWQFIFLHHWTHGSMPSPSALEPTITESGLSSSISECGPNRQTQVKRSMSHKKELRLSCHWELWWYFLCVFYGWDLGQGLNANPGQSPSETLLRPIDSDLVGPMRKHWIFFFLFSSNFLPGMCWCSLLVQMPFPPQAISLFTFWHKPC